MNSDLEELCHEVAQLAAEIEGDLRTRQPETSSQAAGLYMFAKGYKSFQACRLLFSEGFWQDAASVARTLLELGFQARWLNLKPDSAGQLFVRHELRDGRKFLQALKASGSNEIKIKAAASLERLSSADDLDQSWRSWWSKEGNIEKLTSEMEISPTYDLFYRPLCWFVHSSPFANAYYLREQNGNVDFDCRQGAASPDDGGFAEMLFSAAPVGLLEVLAAADTVFVLGRQHEFDRVGATLKSYQEKLSRQAENRRITKQQQ